jgi:hypothetical protein
MSSNGDLKWAWLYRAITLAIMSWTLARVEGVDVLEEMIKATNARITAVAEEIDRRDDAQDRSIEALWQRRR